MAPYPNHAEIAEIFQKMGPKGTDFLAHCEKDINITVMGHDHEHKDSHNSHHEVENDFFKQFDPWFDWGSLKIECSQVIGGNDSPWASVELVISGRSKKGKPYYHETVIIAKFDATNKLSLMRIYVDTAHMDAHVKHHHSSALRHFIADKFGPKGVKKRSRTRRA